MSEDLRNVIQKRAAAVAATDTEDIEKTGMAAIIDGNAMTLDALKHHIWTEHHKSHPEDKQGRRPPNKAQWVSFHERLHRLIEEGAEEGHGPYDPSPFHKEHAHGAKKVAPGSVSRILKAAHVSISSWNSSGRVKGWGNTTRGVAIDAKLDGTVVLTYETGGRGSVFRAGFPTEEAYQQAVAEQDAREAVAREEAFSRASQALQAKGYTVTAQTVTDGNGYEKPGLLVRG